LRSARCSVSTLGTRVGGFRSEDLVAFVAQRGGTLLGGRSTPDGRKTVRHYDVEGRIYDEHGHWVLDEPALAQVADDVIAWLATSPSAGTTTTLFVNPTPSRAAANAMPGERRGDRSVGPERGLEPA